ncbi:helix-turn-helix transcriptional regulator [Paenisporosarcina antarctica]|uniref:YafY family transcriptional regulator n=1 Tax=Paenisporosarcina antarctica TaxID=417367 RepID=A0A4P6ZXT9_9BACL|nr:YafY family protein [Paenisporosarcina antarctica]QBP41271.1 YafY family transcriptional regulator [Paenisporosarcina antarctica]
MTINRHFEIIYILLDRKIVTAKELAEHFEVSTRTIYRDVDVLSGAGIPIYSSKGKGGGISLLEGYSFNASLLTSNEQEDILTGLQTLVVTDFPNSDKIIKKVSRLFKKDTTNWIDIDFSPWGSGPKSKQLFASLRDAIINQFVIHFSYINSEGEKSERNVEPLQLLFKQNAWYLSGYCLWKKCFRIFKISRMREVTVTNQPFSPKPSHNAIKNAETQVAHSSVPVTLRISSKGAHRIYDEFDDHMITKNQDGSYTVNTQFPIGPWLDSYLLSFGILLQEIHPEDLRARMLAQLDKLKNNLNRSE